jgi:hypothetical protein
MNLRHLLSTIDVVSLLTPAPLLVERRALHARCARPDNERKPGAGEESLLPIMPNFNSFIIKWLQNVFLEGGRVGIFLGIFDALRRAHINLVQGSIWL